MNADIMGFIAIAMSLIGFITVWIKIGQDKGRNEEAMKTLKQKTDKNEQDISELKTATHSIELRVAEFMGEIKVRLEYIQKSVEDLKPKGGRRATAK